MMSSLYLSLFVTHPSGHWTEWFGVHYLFNSSELDQIILWNIRWPRSLVALCSGASLGAAGALSQGIFRNSLASPSLVGTASGGVLFAVIGFLSLSIYHTIWLIPLLTIIGCALSHLLISGLFFGLSKLNKTHPRSSDDLVLLGFAAHIFFGGITTLILSLSLNDADQTIAIFKWLFGSYAQATLHDVAVLSITTSIGLIWASTMAYKLDVFSLGTEEAESLSIHTHRLTQMVMICISVLVGGSVASCGGIPFVGLMAPHITRLIIGGSHQKLVWASACSGSILTLICDTLARTIIYPQEIEAGIIMITIGSPFFLFILWKKRSESQ